MARYSAAHRRRRIWWLSRLPVDCPRCDQPVLPTDEWDLDHSEVPLILGGSDYASRPAHAVCNRRAGAELGAEMQRIGRDVLRERFLVEGGAGGTPRISGKISPEEAERNVAGRDETDPVWDSCPWLEEVRTVPGEGTWPRLMSGPHPRAVGSYGPAMIRWAESRENGRLRWWQRLVSLRILEHDDAGQLVWLTLLLTMARQCGKSHWLREWCLWRLHQEALFGEPQLILHTGKDIAVCREIQRPARVWARRQGLLYDVRERNGQEEIQLDESRWMLRAREAVYGYSASQAVVDEAWKVTPEVVEDGLEPTMPEREQPQLALISTAHRRATRLMPDRRADALASLDEPGDVLLIEWSSPRELEITDRFGWRAASPHWTEKRERLIASQLSRALRGQADDPDEPDPLESFRSQWLNVWPAVAMPKPKRDERLLEDGAWADAVDLGAAAVGPVVLAVEDNFGRGAAAAVAGITGAGRLIVWGSLFERRAHAFAWCSLLAGQHPGSRLVVGASLAESEDAAGLPVTSTEKAGATETRTALPLIRELLGSGRLCHDGGAELAAQIGGLWVTPSGAGGLLPSPRSGRSDLARAAAWALVAASRQAEAEPIPFFVY